MAHAARDVLTGEPLRPDAYVLRVSSERLDNARWVHAYGDAPETTPCPARLHTPQVEYGGLGGHCFSRDFARYLASVIPTLVVEADLRIRAWWASDYGRERVTRRFRRQFGPQGGEMRYRIALSLASGYQDYPALMAETGHSAHWLAEQTRMAARYAGEPSGAVRSVRAIEPRRDHRNGAASVVAVMAG